MEIWKEIKNCSKYECSNLGKIRNKNTKRILITNKNIKLYKTIKEAAVDTCKNIDGLKNISCCALGKIKSAYGFKWSYNDYFKKDDNEEWKLYLSIRKNNFYISNYGRIRNNE